MQSGLETYSVDLEIRSFLVPWMRAANIARLAITPQTKLVDLNGPDEKNTNRLAMAELTGLVTAPLAFCKLSYDVPPELFTMWLCLFGPLISWRKKRRGTSLKRR